MKGRVGLTMVELMVASALASILMIALFRLLDVSLDMWTKGETRRAVVEQATATAELLAQDMRALHGGQQGDLLVEWVPFDADGDGRTDRLWPRFRLVRQASVVDLLRVARAGRDPERRSAAAAAADGDARAQDGEPPAAGIGLEPLPPGAGLLQVAWAVVPAGSRGEGRLEGLLLRGEELLEAGSVGTLFDEGAFTPSGQPRPGTTHEVTGGVLWIGVQFATQTSIVRDGWRIGDLARDTAASWDAWNRGRPDPEVHIWNEPGAGMPAVGERPLLPRRVRIEIEFEGARERRRRTTLAEPLEKETAAFAVENGRTLPATRGRHLLVGTEWMEVLGVDGDRVRVRRGARGSAPTLHSAGEMVHHGEPVIVDVPVVLHSDDWNLGGNLGGTR